MTPPEDRAAEALRRRRARSRALVALLLGFAALVYAISMTRTAQRGTMPGVAREVTQ